MKSFILALSVIISALTLHAEQHLSFSGIPITGNMDAFCNKLKEKGYTYWTQKNEMKFFTGQFLRRDAYVGVSATNDSKEVYGVAVIFKGTDSWQILHNIWNNCKTLYTEKYGEPEECVEEGVRENSGNFLIMHNVADERVRYTCTYSLPEGMIKMAIVPWDEGDEKMGTVIINYHDAVNGEQRLHNDLDEI